MTFQEGESRFGKRWNEWDEEEWDIFMADLSPDLFKKPLTILKICEYNDKGKLDILPFETQIQARAMISAARSFLLRFAEEIVDPTEHRNDTEPKGLLNNEPLI